MTFYHLLVTVIGYVTHHFNKEAKNLAFERKNYN